MNRLSVLVISLCLILVLLLTTLIASAQFATRGARWPVRGPWLWALYSELPQLYREFNGIDFGHAHLGETLIQTQDPQKVERARLDVLDFIFSSPAVPPDEELIAPTLVRNNWEVARAFNWAHILHRSLYDLYAADKVSDKEAAVRYIFMKYLEKPEAITSHPLDLHGKLWSFPESKSFSKKFPKFNTQIWAYHWLQGATYDIQLMGNSATQRELMPRLIAFYHGYLRNPPLEWQFMPMVGESSPEFASRYPDVVAVFDNLHMLHDNLDDILSRPDLYPTTAAQRAAMLKILPIYFHRNHQPQDRYVEYHGTAMAEHAGHDMKSMTSEGSSRKTQQSMTMDIGPRPPSARDVISGKIQSPSERPSPESSPAASPHRY